GSVHVGTAHAGAVGGVCESERLLAAGCAGEDGRGRRAGGRRFGRRGGRPGGMAGRGSLVGAEAPAAPLLRARPRRRQKRGRLSGGRPMASPKGMSYVELHCHSAYSFGDGASAPEERAPRAAELGYEAIAITDHDGVWGAMEFAQACTAFGVRPIVGAE